MISKVKITVKQSDMGVHFKSVYSRYDNVVSQVINSVFTER